MLEETTVNILFSSSIKNSFFLFLVAGSIGTKRPLLSSWHKAYQKRTLSIGSENPENHYQRAIGVSSSDSNYPLALRPDPTINHQSHLSSIVETCDTAGYLELINNLNENFIEDNEKNDLKINLSTQTNVYIPTNTLTILSLFLGAIIFILIWYFKQKQIEYLHQKSMMTESSISTTITPPPTPEFHQLEQLTPPFQSRYSFK
jgi:hypothetical protein